MIGMFDINIRGMLFVESFIFACGAICFIPKWPTRIEIMWECFQFHP